MNKRLFIFVWSITIFITAMQSCASSSGGGFDFSKSTEDNYAITSPVFVGKYRKLRKKLDYSYHRYYSESRQLFHDELIDLFMRTEVEDGSMICDRPAQNWLVFTAGCMGVGKGHVIRWLDRIGLFPLKSFVIVDPDEIRRLLPETNQYHQLNPLTMGHLTQKEVGYISEVLTLIGLNSGKNVLVDGSLRNGKWYLSYVKDLLSCYRTLKLAIVHVTASLATIKNRLARRPEREVPDEVILDTLSNIPTSVRILSRFVDLFASFSNELDLPEPVCTRMWIKGKEEIPSDSEDDSDVSYEDFVDSDSEIDGGPDKILIEGNAIFLQPNDAAACDEVVTPAADPVNNSKQSQLSIDVSQANGTHPLDSRERATRSSRQRAQRTRRAREKAEAITREDHSHTGNDWWRDDFHNTFLMQCAIGPPVEFLPTSPSPLVNHFPLRKQMIVDSDS